MTLPVRRASWQLRTPSRSLGLTRTLIRRISNGVSPPDGDQRACGRLVAHGGTPSRPRIMGFA